MKSLVSQSQAHRVSNYGLNLIITLSTISCSFSTQIQSTLESASELISGIVLDTGTRFNQLHQQNSLSCSIDVGDASSACRRLQLINQHTAFAKMNDRNEMTRNLAVAKVISETGGSKEVSVETALNEQNYDSFSG